ncbi:MAG: hypothetical protein KGJ41_02430 [Rhodospirillales bacterium]|nr:hypothetical protein [Rhodospirillales bacterium]MDE2197852.1 hypothetical protein [Rhodospirillales bacterium]MDE2577164.1 hypothetical protein [Rhodospirillales bacterium]
MRPVARHRSSRPAGSRLLALLGAAMLSLGACSPLKYQAGNAFDPTVVAASLHPGQSTTDDVRALLGTPYGTGGAMMPYQESSRLVWTYFFDRGAIDPSNGEITEHMTYLFVFFRDNRFDSSLWFDTM